MKKLATLLVFLFIVASFTSCKASKGCGLTSDTNSPDSNPMENVSNADNTVVV